MKHEISMNETITDEAVDLCYGSYSKEREYLQEFPILSKEYYANVIKESGNRCAVLNKDGKIRAVILYEIRDDGEVHLHVPVYGYGYEDIKYLSMLFQRLLKEYVTKTSHILFDGYAHDDALYRYLTLTRFGINMSYCVRKIKEIDKGNHDVVVRELSKEELHTRWDEVWALLSLMVNHLHESPVFWFGDYTEVFYREFCDAEDVRVFAAFDHDDKIIGVFESNDDEEGFLLHSEAKNVGEAVVYEKYRGRGVAEEMLKKSEEELLKEGIIYDWVNHGTCNPNARGFWDRYFEVYKYTFTRDIWFDEKKEQTSYVED